MKESSKNEKAVFGGGCFWCTEAVFKMLKGVSSVLPGYTGGMIPNPTYEQVCGGKTGHAEAIQITYNSQLTRPTLSERSSVGQVTYNDLLTVFFGSHDPTERGQTRTTRRLTQTTNESKVGTQYRSAIFYTTPEQKKTAEEFIKEINDSNKLGAPVVTEVAPLDVFYPAENYHRDYFATHPGNPYCEVVINPKLEKVQKEFADLLKSPESGK